MMLLLSGVNGLVGGGGLFSEEGEQFAVDFGGVADAHDMWAAVDLDVAGIWQRGVQAAALPVDRQDAVRGAMQDQRRDVDPFDVGAEVVQPAGRTSPGRVRRRIGAGIPNGPDRLFADSLTEVVVEVE